MKNKPAPLLNPGTLKPMTARELDGVFCDELVQQELDDTTVYILSQLYHDGLMEATGVEQTSVFEAAEQFARQRIIPETSSPLTPPRGASCAGMVLDKKAEPENLLTSFRLCLTNQKKITILQIERRWSANG